MFRLVKLALLAGGGYLAYQFIQGMKTEARSGGEKARFTGEVPGQQPRPEQFSESQFPGPQRTGSTARRGANPQNISGPGHGRRQQVIETDEAEGSSGHADIVGRGVVSQ